MRTFKTKSFARSARKADIGDKTLLEAVARSSKGLIDAPLGKFLIKQRVARPKQGRSGGYRAILFFRLEDRSVFLHLFAKSRTENLTAVEEDWYREFARELARLTPMRVEALVESGEWIEIEDEDDQKIPK